MTQGYRRLLLQAWTRGFPGEPGHRYAGTVRLPTPSRPAPRTALVSASAVLAGMVAGWVTGLLRVPRAPG